MSADGMVILIIILLVVAIVGHARRGIYRSTLIEIRGMLKTNEFAEEKVVTRVLQMINEADPD